MANLHQLIMGEAFKNALGSAARETSNMQELAQQANLYALKQIEEQRAEKASLRMDQSVYDDQMNKARILNTDSDKTNDVVVTGKIRNTVIKPVERTIPSLENAPKGFRIKSITSEGKPTYERVSSNVAELPAEQQIQARQLARKIAGVRRSEDILPAIVERLQDGITIDQIEDDLRYSSQSSEFAGPIRSAAQSIFLQTPSSISDKALDSIDDELQRGNISNVKDVLKKAARDTAGTEQARAVLGKERTVEFLGEIQNDLNTLQANGIDTNIFTGSLEDINKKIGRVNNPELRKTATKIQTAIQNYRRSMSGVAFSVPESKEYKDMFPSIGRTANFNTANINALKETMSGDLNNFYSLSMGQDNYNKIYGSTKTDFATLEEAKAANLPVGTKITIGGKKAEVY